MRFGTLLCLFIGVVVGGACSGPDPTNDACTSVGGVCAPNGGSCRETFPYPCGQGGVCCRPGGSTSPPSSGGGGSDASTGG